MSLGLARDSRPSLTWGERNCLYEIKTACHVSEWQEWHELRYLLFVLWVSNLLQVHMLQFESKTLHLTCYIFKYNYCFLKFTVPQKNKFSTCSYTTCRQLWVFFFHEGHCAYIIFISISLLWNFGIQIFSYHWRLKMQNEESYCWIET